MRSHVHLGYLDGSYDMRLRTNCPRHGPIKASNRVHGQQSIPDWILWWPWTPEICKSTQDRSTQRHPGAPPRNAKLLIGSLYSWQATGDWTSLSSTQNNVLQERNGPTVNVEVRHARNPYPIHRGLRRESNGAVLLGSHLVQCCTTEYTDTSYRLSMLSGNQRLPTVTCVK